MVVLLHGFPELAFSWRYQLTALAQAGFHVVAPDQRGYGRTTGWNAAPGTDLRAFRMDNLVRDVLGLVQALGKKSVHAVVGHDFGSHVAAWCALIRPDVFRSLAMLATPFAGPPELVLGAVGTPDPRALQVAQALAGLSVLERPRKHYQQYYSGPDANADMHGAFQGLREFLRGYYHLKSAEGTEERPAPLPDLSASSLATLPTYYVMDAGLGMADTVARSIAQRKVQPSRWLSEESLDVYSDAFDRTRFQGGCCGIAPLLTANYRRGCSSTPGPPSSCLAASSPARWTGVSTCCPVRSTLCSVTRAPVGFRPGSLQTPAIGCSRNNRRRSMPRSSNFLKQAFENEIYDHGIQCRARRLRRKCAVDQATA
jgi:pimeloyl-ACP methyl ester carboxylesterase